MTLAPPDRQPLLLEIAPSWIITKNAQARNAYGTVAQHLVCAALRLTPIPINGNYDVCFDALGPDATYYEVKSVKAKGGKVVCYDWRMAKEAKVDVLVCYAVLLHNVRKSDGSRLVEDYIAGGVELLVLPARVVHDAAALCPLQQARKGGNPRMGYNRTGYRDGYRNVPVKVLKALCSHWTVVYAQYAGHPFSVEVYRSDPTSYRKPLLTP